MRKNLLESYDDTIDCWECAFNENCEELFSHCCVANYAKNEKYLPGEVCHLKYCEKGYYNDLTEDEKKQFVDTLKNIDESSKKDLKMLNIQ